MNPEHLLDQADRLATGGVGRPRQADLRRAVSTAYYALFHLLTAAGAGQVTTRRDIQFVVARAFAHGDMKAVSKQFTGSLPEHLSELAGEVPDDLRLVARTFVDLQQARHQADYDLRPTSAFARETARTYVRRARAAFEAWHRVRGALAAEVYLISLLLHQKLSR